jgi:hypothetical protein
MVPWVLETYRYPPAVLCNRGAAHVVCASECQGRERGSPRQPEPPIAVGQGARAGVQAPARAQGNTPLACGAVQDAEVRDCARTQLQAEPRRVQGGGRRPHAAPSAVAEAVHRPDWVAWQPLVERAPPGGPRGATPGPGRVGAPNGLNIAGPGAGCGATARRLPQRLM